ncbi:uncharacterized protein LOC128754776 isoform X1 [Synchiropus splendidus]|uniref:uncharacterized protein LOC128754776 isoform X1 n=1 Tax=Synchiropus splendidus TaxID=270530 RepID=UPI00237D7E6F|nr:uncharacterized protein LOC128754776 isoform X1 [Synchiropus splendidus]
MTGMLMKISLVFVNMLQSQALRSIKPKAVVALNGKPLNFTCDYQPGMQSHAKYFCRVEEDLCSAQTVWADKHDTVVTAGRYSLYDNTSGAFVSVGLDIVLLEDSGLYWCGVDICERADYITPILLTVVQERNFPLFLASLMGIMVLLIVCLLTVCLFLAAARWRRSHSHQDAETPTSEAEQHDLTSSERDTKNGFSQAAPPPDCDSVEMRKSLCSNKYEELDPSQADVHIYQTLNDCRD